MNVLLRVMRVKELSIVLVTIVAAVYFTASSSGFNTVGNYQTIAQLINNRGLQGKVHAGGYDTLADTLKGVSSGALDFTIDQSAYLQGFLSVLYLYLFRVSGTLLAPPATDTGLTFVTKETADLYISANSKFEGGNKTDVINMPKAIPLPPAQVLNR